MMSSKDSMALAVGQAMLDRIAASAPELSGVGDMDGDVIPADPDVDEPGTGVEPVDGTLVFDYLLREQLVLERDLAERGYFIDDPVHDGLVFVTDEHVNVRCFVGAVVEQEDGRRFAIEFTPPFVDRLIRGNAQRPLADRIRVCAYLVRLAGKTVGLLGDPLRVSGDPVGFLRNTVRLLREQSRLARLEQGEDAATAAKQTDKSTQTTDTRPNPLQEGNQTTHRHDSTVTASKEVA